METFLILERMGGIQVRRTEGDQKSDVKWVHRVEKYIYGEVRSYSTIPEMSSIVLSYFTMKIIFV